MEIIVLGCGDAFGSGGRLQTSFLVRTSNHAILLDCGATILPALHQQDLSSEAIDAVIITHFHGDHIGGLPFLLLEAAKRYQRTKPLTLLSPPGLMNRLEQLLPLLYPATEDIFDAFPIHYLEYGAGKIQLLDVLVEAWEVKHSAESLPHGIRVTHKDKVLAFSGDTAWHPNLIPICREADLFICECNLWAGENAGHLSWEILAQQLPQLTAKEIRLTHVGDEVLERQSELPVPVLQDGEKLQL